jgi:hypothetical protein
VTAENLTSAAAFLLHVAPLHALKPQQLPFLLFSSVHTKRDKKQNEFSNLTCLVLNITKGKVTTC